MLPPARLCDLRLEPGPHSVDMLAFYSVVIVICSVVIVIWTALNKRDLEANERQLGPGVQLGWPGFSSIQFTIIAAVSVVSQVP